VTVASWLVSVDPKQMGLVRGALASAKGIECRSDLRGTLVVVTESAEQAIDAMEETLKGTPGVRSVCLIATFQEADERLVNHMTSEDRSGRRLFVSPTTPRTRFALTPAVGEL